VPPLEPCARALDSRRAVHHSAVVASSARIQRVLDLATELSREEREEVAAELLAALEPHDDVSDQAWNEAWRNELEQRLADPSPGLAWEDARAQLDARLAAVRAERGGR